MNDPVPHCCPDNVKNAPRSLYSVIAIDQPKKDNKNQHVLDCHDIGD
jgi:hypothetical protein